MWFSKNKDQPQPTTEASATASTSTSRPSIPPPSLAPFTNESEWATKGAAGLGAISSLSPECTSLKHRYDSCFNLWFKDYLAIGDDQIRQQQKQSETAADTSGSSAASLASSSVGTGGSKTSSSWFSDSSSSLTSTSATSMHDETDMEARKKQIMERYDSDCGRLFKDYQACVKKAVTERGLDDLIQQARKENPFPFDHQRQADPRPNNPPFPFPAARD
ncbi:uncharacterized protein MEPE_06767 [Melanopsichium pennsylvanicum]|uniref:Uncharacterized protein n=2 Tax=Melanopsichium pennsylvanicum TaxID=63383 RepID=A0AAJ4XTW8_9BASI|nr:conserved hypothetical protein [Melanopsichium pennsylvanicum 4]SNX88056.1 uncharacterized protein MEPE_06767 [Melanopsichium pennsylvanicum]